MVQYLNFPPTSLHTAISGPNIFLLRLPCHTVEGFIGWKKFKIKIKIYFSSYIFCMEVKPSLKIVIWSTINNLFTLLNILYPSAIQIYMVQNQWYRLVPLAASKWTSSYSSKEVCLDLSAPTLKWKKDAPRPNLLLSIITKVIMHILDLCWIE